MPSAGRTRTAAALPTLVIPDVHMRTAVVDEILTALAGRYAHVVFLGDYFDRPPNLRGEAVSADEAKVLVEWLRASLAQPSRTHLVGNHDLSYLSPSRETVCSGSNAATRDAIVQGLKPADLSQFKVATQIGPWLVSHAGFQPPYVEDRDAPTLVCAANEALSSLFQPGGRFPGLLACGIVRGGDHRHGGVTWCDWDDEFLPTAGLNQVVGHTCVPGSVRGRHLRRPEQAPLETTIEIPPGGRRRRSLTGFASCNYCIDTALEVVALLEPTGIRFVRWRKQP